MPNTNPAAIKDKLIGHFSDARIGDDGKPEFSFVSSGATLARIEILQDLLEAMDGDNNPNAAECWKGLRTHIKAKLIGWKNQADQEPRQLFRDRPVFSPKQLEDAKTAAQRVGFLAAAAWVKDSILQAVETMTPVQVNTGLAHTLTRVLEDPDADVAGHLNAGLAIMEQAASEKNGR